MPKAKAKAKFTSNIPEDESKVDQTIRLINGNKYGSNDKTGRGQKMNTALKHIEALFGSQYDMPKDKGLKLIDKLRTTADRWEGLLEGVTAEESEEY